MSKTPLYTEIHDLMELITDMLVAWPQTFGDAGPVHRTLVIAHEDLCFFTKNVNWSDGFRLSELFHIESLLRLRMEHADNAVVWAINAWLYFSILQIRDSIDSIDL